MEPMPPPESMPPPELMPPPEPMPPLTPMPERALPAVPGILPWIPYRCWLASTPGRTVLGGHLLRHAAVRTLVRAGRPLSLSELGERLREAGYDTLRPMPAALSDALRTSRKRGHVERIGRGRYVAATVTRSHLRYVDRVLSELSVRPDLRRASGTWRDWFDPGPVGST